MDSLTLTLIPQTPKQICQCYVTAGQRTAGRKIFYSFTGEWHQRPRPWTRLQILERTNILKYVNVTKNFGRGHISFWASIAYKKKYKDLEKYRSSKTRKNKNIDLTIQNSRFGKKSRSVCFKNITFSSKNFFSFLRFCNRPASLRKILFPTNWSAFFVKTNFCCIFRIW